MNHSDPDGDCLGQVEPAFFRNILEASPEPIVALERDGQNWRIMYVNRAFERRTQYKGAAIRGFDWRFLCVQGAQDCESELLHAAMNSGQSAQGLIRSYCGDGTASWSEVRLSPAGSKRKAGPYVLTLRDVTAERAWREQIEYRALHDELTGLPNRHFLQERIQRAIARACSQGTPFAVVVIDLDRFKQVNDTLGHRAGDELLKRVGERLVSCVREGDTVARIGGDEFVLVLESVNTKARVARIMNRLAACVEAPIEVAGATASVGCSFGISWYPVDGNEFVPLLQRADRAMYAEKGTKRAAWLERPQSESVTTLRPRRRPSRMTHPSPTRLSGRCVRC